MAEERAKDGDGRRRPRRQDFRVWVPLAVRWGDMDAYGHVNNAAYFTYCESARIAYFQAISLEADPLGGGEAPAVVTATCDFLAQVRHPAELDVGARATRLGRTSFTLEYALFRRDSDDLVATGSSVVVWVDYASGRPAPLPDALRRRMAELDGVG